MDDKLRVLVRKWVLDNARRYGGRADSGAVIGRLLADRPDLRSDMKALSKVVRSVIDDVQKLSVEQQVDELKNIAPELLEKKVVREKSLKPLPDAVEGGVVMRIAPSPSGPLQVGHGLVFPLSSEYCRMYNGKLILRIEDTNPDNIDPSAYEMIKEEAKWLTEDNIGEVVVQSDRLKTYYDFCERVLAGGGAYVCTCSADSFRSLSSKGRACPCRDKPVDSQLADWDRMFVEFEPGQAVVRIKTDLNDPNPAMRDWPAFRINHSVHPRTGTKFKVWPLMNFSVAVDDHELGVTHTVRGKDHMDNAKRQAHIFDFFGWKKPHHLYFGLINFVGLELSTTKIRKRIEYGEFSGWDDIRLPFLSALRRRGYQPRAFTKYAVDMGINLNDKTIDSVEFFKKLNAYNRDIIEPVANRYFFVADPVKIVVKNSPKKRVEIGLHPDDRARGVRSFAVNDTFYISRDDLDKIREGFVHRLMDCVNFKKVGNEFVFVSEDVADYRKNGKGILHWLPADGSLVEGRVLMPDGRMVDGLCEPGLNDVKVGSVLQLERFGFCRLDSRSEKLTFWFAHR